MTTTLILACIFLVPSCARAEYIPDTPTKVNQLADAIFWAEGGWDTNYLFGIKSIKCEGYDECRRICKNTIRNNIGRFERRASLEGSQNLSYLTFLQNRYCPTTGNLSASEEELNGHWLKNVKWFLENPREI